MNNKKIIVLFIISATIALLGIVGFTIAYFTSSVDFENEFTSGIYQIQSKEVFTSPDSWMPGDTTPKTLTVKNTGNVYAAVRVCLDEEWTSHNGDILPNAQNGESAAILNLANTNDWIQEGNCYKYKNRLDPNAETSSFIESVTFNPNITSDVICTTNGNTKTCSSSGNGYDNATYKLTLSVETIQYNRHSEEWKNNIVYINRQVDSEITPGDEIAIEKEHFYVVSSDSNKTVLLSKYNLLIADAYLYNDNTGLLTKTKSYSESDNGYEYQNIIAKGWEQLALGSTTSMSVGGIGFSGTNYWDSSVCQYAGGTVSCTGISDLLSEYSQNGETYYSSPHNTNYPYVFKNDIGNVSPQINYDVNNEGYVQNNGYTIAYYVNSYVNKLKNLGAPNSITGRLLSAEEAITLGCNDQTLKCNITATVAPPWVYSTSYWLGSAASEEGIWDIMSDGEFGRPSNSFTNTSAGVRPVIEIPTYELASSVESLNNREEKYSHSSVTMGNVISNETSKFDTPQESIEDYYDIPLYLKYVSDNGIVNEVYAGFQITQAMKNQNSRLTVGYYLLRGGGATYNRSTNQYNNDSPFYSSNKTKLLNAFGSTNCDAETEGMVACSGPKITASAYANGLIRFSYQKYSYATITCDITSSGSASCSGYEED